MRKREQALREAIEFVRCVSRKLKIVHAWLYGSYARGDFNEWSDVDVLIVVEDDLPARPVDRLSIIEECLERYPSIEPVVVTVKEFEKMRQKRNPIVVDVEHHGVNLLEIPNSR